MNRAAKRERLRQVRRACVDLARPLRQELHKWAWQRLRDAWRYGQDPNASWWQRVLERFLKVKQ